MTHAVRAAIFAMLFGSVAALRSANRTNASVAVPALPTQKDVDVESAKLEKIAVLLGHMLKGDLKQSKVAQDLKLFTDNLQSVLTESKTLKPVEAMKKLASARAGVSGLVGELTKTQESLMHEDLDQRESLLMGVLMTHKNATMQKQLELLKSKDFEGLDVSKELLKAHDNKTALYLQAAKYLDVHEHAGVARRKSSVDKIAASFDKRVAALETAAEHEEARHKKKVEWMSKLAKKGGKDAKMMLAMAKHEEHSYKKMSAQSKRDIASMKEAAAAIRSGDLEALNHARAALQKSMDALKNKNAGMLVFLQRAHVALKKDCPYCAAQCVEKCHNKGESYTSCLSECADAGK